MNNTYKVYNIINSKYNLLSRPSVERLSTLRAVIKSKMVDYYFYLSTDKNIEDAYKYLKNATLYWDNSSYIPIFESHITEEKFVDWFMQNNTDKKVDKPIIPVVKIFKMVKR